MKNLTRYNLNFPIPVNSQYGNNNIEKYLKNEIDFLLAPSADQLNGVEFEDVYISNPSAEKFLSSALTYSQSDKVLYLTGLTGSGKSMILKHVFKYHGMAPIVHDKSLIVPFSFDNFPSNTTNLDVDENGIKNVYINMLSSACELIEKLYPNLKIVYNNEKEFLDIVAESRSDYTQIINAWPRPNTKERIKHFMNENPIPFNTAILKYYLNQKECPINNIVFLVDDIEGAGENQELIPIKTAYRIITCLENTPKTKDWSVQLIISCRNYVYRLIIDRSFSVERQRIETYTEAENHHLEKAPSITDIVKKRYQAISKKDKNEKWKTALDTVLAIMFKIDSQIGEFILNLKIRNIRKALALTKRIVYNKQWIQRDYIEEAAGAFTIDSVKDYDITTATLIRAIGMGESLIYSSNISDIPNVMFNENETDLYPLLVLKYCLHFRSNDNKYADWNDTIDLCAFYNKIAQVFGDNSTLHKPLFVMATQYLILNRLLLRSIDQLQNNAMPVNEKNVHEITKVYISNAAVDMWELLSKNSVLFEMYMDDIWLDNSNRPVSKKKFRGFDLDNFNMTVIYLEKLIDKENQLKNHAQNLGTLDEYNSLFGKKSICQHLLTGLLNSLNAFYKDDAYDQNLMHKILELSNKISKLTN